MRRSNITHVSSADTRFLGTISAASVRNLLPTSISYKSKTNSNPIKLDDENTPPVDPNIRINQLEELKPSPTLVKHSPSDVLNSQHVPAAVKVVLRIRPALDGENERDWAVKKVSSDAISVGERRFTFDSIFDSKANQEDVFQLVGIPLVQNALAGYNTSILSYGQSGSGKTYTMWGPPSAMVEDPSPNSHQGIVPRIFQMLFSQIEKEQKNSEGKQINYQCRCSFLEIHNGQIGDLLDPIQRNLKIKDDSKNGPSVENLTEEYVTSYEDVMQIFIKGLSSRKVGATRVNSKSSRSHIVFTFIIESWCKETSSKCFGSSKTSRINLIDLAGLNRNETGDPSSLSTRQEKSVRKSLSRLGHLVQTLAKGSRSEKTEEIYRASCLTNLLRESLGGNSKLTVICALSPNKNNDRDILRTLRFGERVKCVRNEPVINEITEDDVNDLSHQIRQLKEELIRAKSNASNSVEKNRHGYFQGQNVRESLNHLRVSLNRSLILPRVDNGCDEEMKVDENDVMELREQLEELRNSCEKPKDYYLDRDNSRLDKRNEIDLMNEDDDDDDDMSCSGESETEGINLKKSESSKSVADNPKSSPGNISINSCLRCPVLQDPTLSESPKIGRNRRSETFSSSSLVCQNVGSDNLKAQSVLGGSLGQGEHIRSSLQSSRIFAGPTESLAASLQRGLQIIDYHQRNSASNKSSVALSFDHLTLKPCPENDEANTPSRTFLCSSCRHRVHENNTSEAHKEAREELEKCCMDQGAKIEQLNQLIEQYKREKLNSAVQNGQESNLSGNEIIPFLEAKHDKMILKCNSVYNLQPETIKENYEIKEVQQESVFGCSSNSSLDVHEKEALLEEIQILKNKLNSQTDASSDEKMRSSLLARSIKMQKNGGFHNRNEEEMEMERRRWTETESEWITLTDELRTDMDTHRRRAEMAEAELQSEKKCTEELEDALRRAVLGHARIIEHYADLQEKHNDLVGKHRSIMEGVAEVKRAAEKAGKKGQGSRFHKALTAELCTARGEREREREFLRKENRSLRSQLRDTAEAVHAAGELLVRLREAEHAASVAEEKCRDVQQDNEKLRKQMEKLKRRHKLEMITVKQYFEESRLPGPALEPLFRGEDSDANAYGGPDDDQAWRAEFGAIYQEHL